MYNFEFDKTCARLDLSREQMRPSSNSWHVTFHIDILYTKTFYHSVQI